MKIYNANSTIKSLDLRENKSGGLSASLVNRRGLAGDAMHSHHYLKVGIIMNESNRNQENTVPNIHVPENEKVLSLPKEMHPFREIIVPFSGNKVNQDTTPSDLVGHFASMSSLPGNSK